jgi:hypothetical protein
MTELMVQKGIDEIVKYGSEAEILDFLIMILTRIKTRKFVLGNKKAISFARMALFFFS